MATALDEPLAIGAALRRIQQRHATRDALQQEHFPVGVPDG